MLPTIFPIKYNNYVYEIYNLSIVYDLLKIKQIKNEYHRYKEIKDLLNKNISNTKVNINKSVEIDRKCIAAIFSIIIIEY